MKYTFDWKEYAKLAREAVTEGVVLLRNENKALPINKGEKVSVFGRIQLDYYKSGTGSGGMVNAPYVVSILDGLKNCEEISINSNLENIYREWVKENPFDPGVGWAMEPWCQKEMELTEEVVKAAATESDLAIVIIGRSAGEDKDSSYERGSYLLTDLEEDMLKKVCGTFKRTIVLLNVGSIMDMRWVDKYKPQAVMYVWQGGMEGGNGIADVLTGKVSPSGKLSDTIAYEIKDYPSTENFGGEKEAFYAEDIYVGYRYFEMAAKDRVMYPFGYGLSYTDFSYNVTEMKVTGEGIEQKIQIKAEILNTGDVAGKESLQVYYCPPQGKLGKANWNLVRFGKTKKLEAGEKDELVFTFSISEMASYDDTNETGHKSCYVLEAGKYEFYVGQNIRNVTKAGEIELEDLIVVKELCEALAPVKPFQRMRIRNGEIEWQQVPLREINLQKRIAENRPKNVVYTGDQGYKLADVYDGKISMKTFLSQLSDEELTVMMRGEGMCSPRVTPGIAGAMGGVSDRLLYFGIPAAGCADGPSGIRMDCGTMAFSLPNGTLLACSYNTELVERLYEMEGKELRKNQIDALLGPGINIHRNPLNGRNFEYFSEDPYLTGAMAVAELKGMHKFGVTGTIKHFACNNQETMRHTADSVVSERALREIYLKAFQMCVEEAGAYYIMSSYQPINGFWTASNYDLLTTILRGEWGYEGAVMTDWWAKMNEEGEEGYRENTIAMIRSQNDIYMCNGNAAENSNHDNTEEGLKNGQITRGELIRNATNICSAVMKSLVMERFLKRDLDECEELNRPECKTGKLIEMQGAVIDSEKEVSLSLEGISTEAGCNVQYALTIPNRGEYRLKYKIKSDLGELAQMNITVSVNNTIVDTIAITGTNGKWIEAESKFSVFVAVENYLNLYFGQSGVDIQSISVEPV